MWWCNLLLAFPWPVQAELALWSLQAPALYCIGVVRQLPFIFSDRWSSESLWSRHPKVFRCLEGRPYMFLSPCVLDSAVPSCLQAYISNQNQQGPLSLLVVFMDTHQPCCIPGRDPSVRTYAASQSEHRPLCCLLMHLILHFLGEYQELSGNTYFYVCLCVGVCVQAPSCTWGCTSYLFHKN